MYYNSHCSTRSDGCAPETERVSSQPPIQRRSSLARAIALVLMAGSMVVPAVSWAEGITVSGVKFIDLDRDGAPRETDELPYRKGGTIYLISTTAPDGTYPSTVQAITPTTGEEASIGRYTFTGVAPGDYLLWQYVNPASSAYPLMTGTNASKYYISRATAKLIHVSDTAVTVEGGGDLDFPVVALPPGDEVYISGAQGVADKICVGTGDYVLISSGSLQSPATFYQYSTQIPSLANAVLIVSPGAVLQVPNFTFHVQAVCNQGTIIGEENGMVAIEYDDFFANLGDGKIEGDSVNLKRYLNLDGQSAGCDDESEYSSITSSCDYFGLFYNTGTIQGRNGLDKAHADTKTISPSNVLTYAGGDAGSVSVQGQSVVQNRTIQSGKGGNVTFNESYYGEWATNQDLKVGGDGGTVTVTAEGGGKVIGNASSVTEAGLGGDVSATSPCVDVVAWGGDPSLCSHYGLKGGDSGELTVTGGYTVPKGLYKGSSIYVDPTVSFVGSETTLVADKDIVIFGGDNWLLELRNVHPEAITAGRKIILATGAGGTIDLRGNTANIFKAGVQIEIYTDNLLLDNGVTLEQLVSEVDGKKPEIVRGGSKIIYHATLSATSQITGKANEIVPISFDLRNAGPKSDTYNISVASINGSTVSDVPATVTLEAFKRADLNFNVTLPAEGNDVITVTATSQADSTVVATTRIQASVEKPVVVEPEKVALTVGKVGEGSVTAQGIDCGEDCTEDFALNTEVKLVATPAEGYQFVNWSGDCATDTLTMDAAKSCTATFTVKKVALTVGKVGEGSVTAQGIDCGEDCTEDFALNTEVKLAATPAKGYEFANWSGNCATDTLTMDAAKSCTATFTEIGKYTTHGTLKDKAGNVLAGVTVQIGDKTTVTDGAGNWEIGGLVEGKYDVVAMKDNFACLTSDVELGNQQFLQAVTCEPVTSLKAKLSNKQWGAIPQGNNAIYTVTIFNGGEVTATGVALNGNFPKGATLVNLQGDTATCDLAAASCALADLAPGTSTTLTLEIGNLPASGNFFMNSITLTSIEYPADVAKSWRKVKPYLSLLGKSVPNPVVMGGKVHYQLAAELLNNAPETTATEVKAEILLPPTVKFVQATASQGSCEPVAQKVACDLGTLSVTKSDDVSRVNIDIEVELGQDLVQLNAETKISAANYVEHRDIISTATVLGDGKVDGIILLDITKSMDEELEAVKKAIQEKLKQQYEGGAKPVIALVVFRDDVEIKAISSDLQILLDALNQLQAKDGGLCPEASAQALDLALDHLKPNGVIIFVTDAPPYADTNIEALKAKIVEKQANFISILTKSDCAANDLSQ